MRLLHRWRKFMQQMNDQKMNREFIGTDKYGNSYYQYFSYFGLPTRREIHYAQKHRLKFFEDNAFYFWLNKRDELPPTQEQQNQYYLDEETRRQKAIEWDKKEALLSEEYKQQQILIEQTWKEQEKQQQIESNEKEFTPESWNPMKSRKKM